MNNELNCTYSVYIYQYIFLTLIYFFLDFDPKINQYSNFKEDEPDQHKRRKHISKCC